MGVAFVAHCLLNQNSKVLDGAHCAGVYSPIIDVLRERGWRIEQMPCPELAFAGLGRFWAVREQYDTAAFRRHCQRLATAVAGAIVARVQQGEEIVLVGVEGSPSMGVTITSSDPQRGGRPAWPDGSPELTGGEGIYVEELHAELGRRGITVRVAGETHAIPGHDEAVQRARLESALEHRDAGRALLPRGPGGRPLRQPAAGPGRRAGRAGRGGLGGDAATRRQLSGRGRTPAAS